MYTHSNYWGDADVDHSQTIGGDTAKLLEGIYPPIVSAPLVSIIIYLRVVSNFSVVQKPKVGITIPYSFIRQWVKFLS